MNPIFLILSFISVLSCQSESGEKRNKSSGKEVSSEVISNSNDDSSQDPDNLLFMCEQKDDALHNCKFKNIEIIGLQDIERDIDLEYIIHGCGADIPKIGVYDESNGNITLLEKTGVTAEKIKIKSKGALRAIVVDKIAFEAGTYFKGCLIKIKP